MNDVNVGNYASLESAAELNKAYVTQIDNAKEIGKKAGTQLSDESIFKGPVQEECVSLISQVNESMDTLSENFTKLANFLTAVGETYKTADSSASQTITNVGNS